MRCARRIGAVVVAVATLASCSGDDGGVEARGAAGEATETSTDDEGDDEADDTGSSFGVTTEVPYAGYTSEIYVAADKWICRPDLATDRCRDGELDLNVVRADGSSDLVSHQVVEDAPIDCFYVYPTLNFGDAGNTSFDTPATELEVGTVYGHAGPFSSVCRVFAPRYRQLTLGGFGTGDRELAYGDVADAFKHYMANDNEGRGVVLMGHSQGAGHLNRLIQEEFDDDPEMRARLVSALLIGSGVIVPAGEDLGGSFEHVPACRSDSQVGCVISYASFRSTSPPPENSLFGRPREGDGQVLCTNPGALEGRKVELDPWFPPGTRAYADDALTAALPPGMISLPGLVSGECVERDGYTYLEITVNGDPADPRVDEIGGDLTPEWGLHAIDVQLALGDLLRVVRAQADAWTASAP